MSETVPHIIHILPPEVFNQIAAGEVVDAPKAIVKELVENSIDAGATAVTVEVREGGIGFIKVSDNGRGIPGAQAARAFLPHATSKVETGADLFRIATLGFRGEALASIAAVARVKLLTRTADAEFGTEVTSSAGVTTACERGAPQGTYVTVTDLFYNVPARAKFLKKPKSEEADIHGLVTRLILANPRVSIKLIAEGKTLLHSAGQGLDGALAAVYGRDILSQCVEIKGGAASDVGIYGYAGKLSYSKPSRGYQTLVINGRYVVNQTVIAAVTSVYLPHLMKRQYPFFVLHLTMPYDGVDVNVHPNKLDVRFENGSRIYALVANAVSRHLLQITEVPAARRQETVSAAPRRDAPPQAEASAPVRAAPPPPAPSAPIRASLLPQKKEPLPPRGTQTFSETDALVSLSDSEASLWDALPPPVAADVPAPTEAAPPAADLLGVPRAHAEVVGTLFDTYILVALPDCFFLIDQHAAHERLLFDRLTARRSPGSQTLLLPYVFDVSPADAETLEDALPALAGMGFDVRPYGGRSYAVSAVPAPLTDMSLAAFVGEVLSNRRVTTAELLHERLATAACKAAIKGGDRLPRAEIDRLLALIAEGKPLPICPHGRPIAVRVGKTEVEKWFRRITQ